MSRMTKLLALATALAFTLPAITVSPFGAAPAFAKKGADDPAGDDRGGHGADDPAGDDRGGHGNDDGPNHD